MAVRLKRKTENWRRRLPRPIRLRDGKTLAILADCRAYVLELDSHESARQAWQRAAELMMAAAAGGDLDAVARQFESILIHQNKIRLPDDAG